MRSLFIILVMALGLVACSTPEDAVFIPKQKWGDIVVEVQSRPMRVQPGMNEFLIIATLERGMPVGDLVVSIRSSDRGKWKQGIQDGLSGVYRKAINIPESATQLQVQLRKKRTDEEQVLIFPLYPEQEVTQVNQ